MSQILRALAAASLLLALVAGTASAAPPPQGPEWLASWTTAPQYPGTAVVSNWSDSGFGNHTLRQVVRLSAGGPMLRVRLTNRFGTAPLRVSGATVARATTGPGTDPRSVRPLTVALSPLFTVPPGEEIVSDPIHLPVTPLDSVTITLYLPKSAGPATQHPMSLATSYRAPGNQIADLAGGSFRDKTESWYYLSGIDVAPVRPLPGTPVRVANSRPGIAVFGDSLTDGVGSTVDAHNRFPDELAERLVALGQPRPVLNQGISGNRVTVDSKWQGESGLRRFQRDVLAQPGVGTVIILAGVNDVGLGNGGVALVQPTVERAIIPLLASYRALAKQARDAGMRVVGATLLPFKGSPYYSARTEAARAQINEWIRTSGDYDSVLDLDAVMSDAVDKRRLNPEFDSGDHIHPSDAGYRAMAHAVDLTAI